MVFFSQGVRRWKGVSEKGGREWESCFNELSPGSERKHMRRLVGEAAWKKIPWQGEQKASRMSKLRAVRYKLECKGG